MSFAGGLPRKSGTKPDKVILAQQSDPKLGEKKVGFKKCFDLKQFMSVGRKILEI